MEFLSLDGLYHLVKAAGWTKKNILDAIEQGQLVAIQVEQPRTRNKKLAILHPGIKFLQYINDPTAHFRNISILSEGDVASILNRSYDYVRWLVRTGKLKPIVTEKSGVRYANFKGRYKRRRFTVEAVRQYIINSTGRDPKKRAELTAEVLTEWFWRQMNLEPKVTGVEAVDEELSWIDSMPEPERSRHIDRLLRLAEDARDRLAAECENKKAPALRGGSLPES